MAWTAAECERQRTTPTSVVHLLRALDYARDRARLGPPSVGNIVELAMLVLPGRNHAFRSIPVVFSQGSPALPPEHIERTLSNLLDAPLAAEEWFVEFERIHPFEDGNGRVGAILFNWRAGTLEAPQGAPDYLRR